MKIVYEEGRKDRALCPECDHTVRVEFGYLMPHTRLFGSERCPGSHMEIEEKA